MPEATTSTTARFQGSRHDEQRQTNALLSVRTGKNPFAAGFDLDTLRDLFRTQFIYFEDEGYFQEALGFNCVDQGFIPGTLGHDLEGALLLQLRKRNLHPSVPKSPGIRRKTYLTL